MRRRRQPSTTAFVNVHTHFSKRKTTIDLPLKSRAADTADFNTIPARYDFYDFRLKPTPILRDSDFPCGDAGLPAPTAFAPRLTGRWKHKTRERFYPPCCQAGLPNHKHRFAVITQKNGLVGNKRTDAALPHRSFRIFQIRISFSKLPMTLRSLQCFFSSVSIALPLSLSIQPSPSA